MSPIKLSDVEIDAVLAAARPIAADRRDAFMRDVALSLAGCSEIGPGILHRTLVQVQRVHFDPPETSSLREPRPRR
jgi:hypothetical protein